MKKYEMKKVDFSTLSGMGLAICFFASSIMMSSSSISLYLNAPSMLIVFGSTVAISCACFSFRDVGNAFRTISDLLVKSPANPSEVARLCLKSAELCYKSGINSIGKKLTSMPLYHKTFIKWLEYVVDNEKIELIDKLISQEIYSHHEEQTTVIQLIRRGAELAPAYGLIGTIVGLVQMLSAIQDINLIGEGLSLALLTTLYGAILAYLVLVPLASKLERNLKEEMTNLCLMHRTIISVAKQENPRQLEPVVNSILPPGKNIVYFHYK
ncbi:MAG: MotA/TolQ/ExbB proton channel family protein [Rickettsiaceae bacterium]|nr:MotA/TolQ/ExbB proton channel family protein [Rickettsiaceae bacterium]